MILLLFLLQTNQLQAPHEQVLVVNDLIAAVAHNNRRIAAGGHDGGIFTGDDLLHAVDDAVQHPRRAIDDAVAHTVLGVFADKIPGWVLQGYILQQRRVLRQGIQRQPHPREHHATLIGLLLGDIGNGGGCAHLDHNNGRRVFFHGGHGIGHQVGAQLIMDLHADVQARFDAGAHHHGLLPQQAGQRLMHHEINSGNDAGKDGPGDLMDVIAVQGEKIHQINADLIGCLAAVRVDRRQKL